MAETTAKLIRQGVSDRQQAEILLVDDVTTLGRAASCQVVIDSDFASRRHAQIVRRDDLYWLRDLNSKNGILVDNEPVSSEILLNDGAEIRIGETVLRFVDPFVTRTQPGLAGTASTLWIDADRRDVWVQGDKLEPPLSPKQFNLLLYLYQRAGEAISKDALAAAVWPEVAGEAVYDYQIDKMVSRVRERIGKDWIETVWGYGYRLRLL
ncbi:MAG: FHA domain-containing protein [Anaerolineae bacterium]|nr:FHA domain-containing protein [Anaerolineae bacterium]